MILYYVLPYVISGVILAIAFLLNWSYKIENFDRVLDSIITFSSIILGFLGALLGILITIKDSGIMREIYRNNFKVTLKFYFYEAIISGFTVIIASTIMYLLIDQDYKYNTIMFYAWIFVSSLFFVTSFRVITTLMSILFKSDVEEVENNQNGQSHREDEATKDRLTKDTKGLKDSKQKVDSFDK